MVPWSCVSVVCVDLRIHCEEESFLVMNEQDYTKCVHVLTDVVS
jgi:hypothetical protein